MHGRVCVANVKSSKSKQRRLVASLNRKGRPKRLLRHHRHRVFPIKAPKEAVQQNCICRAEDYSQVARGRPQVDLDKSLKQGNKPELRAKVTRLVAI